MLSLQDTRIQEDRRTTEHCINRLLLIWPVPRAPCESMQLFLGQHR